MRRTSKLSILAGMAIMLAMLAFGPRLIDSDALRIALIDQLSTALGYPVAIQYLDLRLLPRPSVTLNAVEAGFGEEPQSKLAMGRLQVSLSWRALLHGDITITQLDVDSVELNSILIARLQQLIQGPEANPDTRRPILHIKTAILQNVTWDTTDGRRLGPFIAKMTWQEALRPSLIEIAQMDGRLQARLSPDETGIEFLIEAHDWDAPLSHDLIVRQIQGQGRYENHSIILQRATLDSFEGQTQLSGTLAWAPAWHINAKFAGQHLDLPSLLTVFGLIPIKGLIAGDCDLSIQGTDLLQSLQQPVLDCQLQHTQGETATKLTLRTERNDTGIDYSLSATDLIVPIGPPLQFKKLDAHGTLDKERLQIKSGRIEGYNGIFETRGELTWRNNVQLSFESDSAGLQLAPLLAAFNRHSLDGQLDSHCKGRLSGSGFSTLLTQPKLDCDFDLVKGELYNADLEQAAKLIKASDQNAGSTPFDRLSGKLHMAQGASHFTELRLQSTALVATGDITIDPADQLNGELSAALKNTAGMVSVPLVVSGPVGNPFIRPTTSAMAGGAAGTMILGPGLGTAVGVKLGETIQKVTRWLKPKRESMTGESINE